MSGELIWEAEWYLIEPTPKDEQLAADLKAVKAFFNDQIFMSLGVPETRTPCWILEGGEMPSKSEEFRIKVLTGGYIVTEAKPSQHSHGATTEQVFAAETKLVAAKWCLKWLGFDLPDVEKALIILEGNHG